MSAATVAPQTAGTQQKSSREFPGSARVVLQRRAPGVIRRHSVRSAIRVLVLLACDLAVFFALRAVVRAVRDLAVLGSGLAAVVGSVLPTGYFGGLQFAVAMLGGLAVAGTYLRGDYRRNAKRIFAGVALAGALVLWQSLWTRGVPAVLLQYISTVGGVGMCLTLGRRAIDRIVKKLNGRVRPAERVLFVGALDDSEPWSISKKLLDAEHMESVGWLTTAGNVGWRGSRRGAVQAIGSVEDIWSVLRDVQIDSVVICGSMPPESFDLVVEASAAAGCRLLAVSRYAGVGLLRPSLVRYRSLPLVELTVPSLRGNQMLIKRIIDILGAAAGLVLLAPLLALIAAAIKLDSRGPVFFMQQRVGRGGRLFRMLKFRTMRDGADAEKELVAHLNHTGDHRLFKIPDDPRVTRIGQWLRRWSLDELPQLGNVLKGEMSLVGPRPFFESDLGDYRDHHFARLGAKPGLTGLWQVSGRSSVVDFEEVVRLDREYIDQWSLALDFKILGRTLPAVFTRTGAF